MKLAISFAFFASAALAGPPQPLHFHFQTDETSTAIYHLACLDGNIPCSKAAFQTFWHTTQNWTQADQAQLDIWSTILRKIWDAALPPEPAAYIGNSPGLMPAVSAQHLVMRAALEARNVTDFQGRTWQWIDTSESTRLYGAITHFRARLHPSARKEVNVLLPQIEKSMRKNGMPALAAQIAQFCETNLKTGDVYFHLVPGPVFDSERGHGTPVSNHVFVEITTAVKPVPAASIMLHELTHYFYDNAPPPKQAALVRQFAQSGSPEASSLYAILNEAIAVAVQAILAETSKSADDSYRDPFIPRAGRATIAPLKDALAKGTTLFQPGFVEAYIPGVSREIGSDSRDPKFLLNSAAFLPTDKGLAAYELFLQELQPIIFLKSDRWQLFPKENLVFLTAYDEWNSLANSIPELASHSKKRGFAFIATGSEGQTICVLAGVDSAAIVDVVKAFTSLKSLPAAGLALALD